MVITFVGDLQYDTISEFEEDDFEDSSQILFDNTEDRNMRDMLVNLDDYSEDDESDEEVASSHHFRRSYEFRNRPLRDTKGKEIQQKNKQAKRKQPQRKQSKSQSEPKSSIFPRGHLRNSR